MGTTPTCDQSLPARTHRAARGTELTLQVATSRSILQEDTPAGSPYPAPTPYILGVDSETVALISTYFFTLQLSTV